jgi:hypothetical protein
MAITDQSFRRLGNALHAYCHDIEKEPLPKRWIELIRYLNEKEREHFETHEKASASDGAPLPASRKLEPH